MFPGTLSSEQVGVLIPAAAQQLFSLHSYFQAKTESNAESNTNSGGRDDSLFVSCLTDHMHHAVRKLESLNTSTEEINCFLRVHRLLSLSDPALLNSAYSSSSSSSSTSASSFSSSSSSATTSTLQHHIHEVAYTLINSVAKLPGNATPEMTDLIVLIAQAGLELGLPLIHPSFYTVTTDNDDVDQDLIHTRDEGVKGGKEGERGDTSTPVQIENNVIVKREKGDSGGKEGSDDADDVLNKSLNSKTLLSILLTPITAPSPSLSLSSSSIPSLALSRATYKTEPGVGTGVGSGVGTGTGMGTGAETGAGMGAKGGQVQGSILMDRFSSQLISYIVGVNGESFKKHGRGFVDCILKTVKNLKSGNTENNSKTDFLSGSSILMRLSRGVIGAVLMDLKAVQSIPAAVACNVITYFLPLFIPSGDSMIISLQSIIGDEDGREREREMERERERENDDTILDLLEIDSMLHTALNQTLRSSMITHCFKLLKHPSQVSLPRLTIALRALPFILTGYSATSPRSYLRYNEEPETVAEVR